MENETPTFLQVAAGAVFFVMLLYVIGLQFLANRHRREGYQAYMLKDSLFRNKELVFTEEGMRYIRRQKLAMVAGSFACVGLIVLDRLLG